MTRGCMTQDHVTWNHVTRARVLSHVTSEVLAMCVLTNQKLVWIIYKLSIEYNQWHKSRSLMQNWTSLASLGNLQGKEATTGKGIEECRRHGKRDLNGGADSHEKSNWQNFASRGWGEMPEKTNPVSFLYTLTLAIGATRLKQTAFLSPTP